MRVWWSAGKELGNRSKRWISMSLMTWRVSRTAIKRTGGIGSLPRLGEEQLRNRSVSHAVSYKCSELINSGTTEKKGRWRLLRQDCRRTEGSTSLVLSLNFKHKLIAGPKTLNDTQLRKELKGKDRERQYGPCLRPRYKGWGKCTQCVAKMSGDSCRFRNFRMFK